MLWGSAGMAPLLPARAERRPTWRPPPDSSWPHDVGQGGSAQTWGTAAPRTTGSASITVCDSKAPSVSTQLRPFARCVMSAGWGGRRWRAESPPPSRGAAPTGSLAGATTERRVGHGRFARHVSACSMGDVSLMSDTHRCGGWYQVANRHVMGARAMGTSSSGLPPGSSSTAATGARH